MPLLGKKLRDMEATLDKERKANRMALSLFSDLRARLRNIAGAHLIVGMTAYVYDPIYRTPEKLNMDGARDFFIIEKKLSKSDTEMEITKLLDKYRALPITIDEYVKIIEAKIDRVAKDFAEYQETLPVRKAYAARMHLLLREVGNLERDEETRVIRDDLENAVYKLNRAPSSALAQFEDVARDVELRLRAILQSRGDAQAARQKATEPVECQLPEPSPEDSSLGLSASQEAIGRLNIGGFSIQPSPKKRKK